MIKKIHNKKNMKKGKGKEKKNSINLAWTIRKVSHIYDTFALRKYKHLKNLYVYYN